MKPAGVEAEPVDAGPILGTIEKALTDRVQQELVEHDCWPKVWRRRAGARHIDEITFRLVGPRQTRAGDDI